MSRDKAAGKPRVSGFVIVESPRAPFALVAPARCRALHGEDVRRRVCDELVDNSCDVECDDSSSSWS